MRGQKKERYNNNNNNGTAAGTAVAAPLATTAPATATNAADMDILRQHLAYFIILKSRGYILDVS